MPSSGSKQLVPVLEIVAAAIGEFFEPGNPISTELFVSAGLQELIILTESTPTTSGQDGILRTSVGNQQIVYGQTKTGGVLVFGSAWGSNGSNTNAYMTVGVAHSLTRQNSAATGGMAVEGIEGLYINDIYIPVNADDGEGGWNAGRGNVGGTPTSISTGVYGTDSVAEPYNPLAGNYWVSFSDGSQTTPDAAITGNYSGGWTADYVGYGICYSVHTFFMSAAQDTFTAAFPQGFNTPGTIGVIISGQKLYDPRLDSDNGGSGSHRLNDTATWTFSSNPALVLADYLTRSKSDGGCGFSWGSYSGSSVIDSQINWAYVAAAANVCDTEVTVPAYGATYSSAGWSATVDVSQYSFNGCVDTSRNCDDNCSEILKTMAGFMVCSDGQIFMYAGAPTDSSGDLDETYLAGPASLSAQISRSQMYNAVKFTYGQEPQADYNQAQGQPIINPTYETDDGGVRLWLTDSIGACNNQFQCQILERIRSQRSRNKMLLTLTCNIKALVYRAGDVVDVTISELGLSSSPFRIKQFSMAGDYKVKMTLQQENTGTYDIPETPDDVYQAYDVSSYQELYSYVPSAPGKPASMTATALPSGILVQWVPPAPNTYEYETVHRSTSSNTGYTAIANVVGDSYLDSSAVSGTMYYYYVNATNYWGNASALPSLPGCDTTAITGPSTTDGALVDTTITTPAISGGTQTGTSTSGNADDGTSTVPAPSGGSTTTVAAVVKTTTTSTTNLAGASAGKITSVA